MIGALTALAVVVGTAPAKKGSSFSPILLIYAVIAAAFYFLYYRPRKRKAQEAKEQANAWDVGDEVLTAGGLVGHIIDIDGDRVTLETSVGASFVVLKQYVLRKIEPEVPVEDDDEEFDDLADEQPADDADDEEYGDADAHHDPDADDAVEDEEHDDTDPSTAGGPGAPTAPPGGNRRARRRGLQKRVDGEDPGDTDGQPAA